MRLPILATKDRVTDAVLIISCGILQAAALAVAAFATRDAFAALHTGHVLSTRTVTALGASGVIAAGCLLISRCRAEALGQSYAISLRRTLYTQIARLPKSRHKQRRVGALSLRFVGDLSAARLWFGRGLPDILSAAVVLPGAMAILFALDPALALAGLAPLSAALLIMAALAWHLERRHRQLRQQRARIAIGMIERIAVAPELDLMGRTKKELRQLDGQGALLRDKAVARRGRNASLQSILQIGVALSGLAMLIFASQNGITPATVAASLSVLALVALPLQDLGAAWDHYCAWRVAREKAQRLLDEPTLIRRRKQRTACVSVEIQDQRADASPAFFAKGGDVTKLHGPQAQFLARCISGLDANPDVTVLFDGKSAPPRIAHIDNTHVGLQGSLRRSATLMCRKRPGDRAVEKVLTVFGLTNLLTGLGGLDQRIAENGNGLTGSQTLRIDLARAVLGKVDVIVISSIRWAAEADQDSLLKTLRDLTPATVILAETANEYSLAKNTKAT